MQLDPEAIFDAASRLSEIERLTLAARLLETVPDEASGLSLDAPNLIEELNRRLGYKAQDAAE